MCSVCYIQLELLLTTLSTGLKFCLGFAIHVSYTINIGSSQVTHVKLSMYFANKMTTNLYKLHSRIMRPCLVDFLFDHVPFA